MKKPEDAVLENSVNFYYQPSDYSFHRVQERDAEAVEATATTGAYTYNSTTQTLTVSHPAHLPEQEIKETTSNRFDGTLKTFLTTTSDKKIPENIQHSINQLFDYSPQFIKALNPLRENKADKAASMNSLYLYNDYFKHRKTAQAAVKFAGIKNEKIRLFVLLSHYYFTEQAIKNDGFLKIQYLNPLVWLGIKPADFKLDRFKNVPNNVVFKTENNNYYEVSEINLTSLGINSDSLQKIIAYSQANALRKNNRIWMVGLIMPSAVTGLFFLFIAAVSASKIAIAVCASTLAFAAILTGLRLYHRFAVYNKAKKAVIEAFKNSTIEEGNTTTAANLLPGTVPVAPSTDRYWQAMGFLLFPPPKNQAAEDTEATMPRLDLYQPSQ